MFIVRTAIPLLLAFVACLPAVAAADERPSVVSLHQSLVDVDVEIQTSARRDIQNIFVNGVPLPSLQFVDVRAILTPQETASLRRRINSEPEAADMQVRLSNLFRAFDFLDFKEFVAGIEGNTVFYFRERAVR